MILILRKLSVMYSLRLGCKNSCQNFVVHPKTKKGEDKLLFICSYVAYNPVGCWEELTCGNVKLHSLFNSYLSTLNQSLNYLNALI